MATDADADDIERQLTRATQRRRRILLVVGAALIVAAISPCAIVAWRIGGEMREREARREEHSKRATPAQVAAVDRATAALEASLPARAAAWRTAMAGAAALVPRPDRGGCAIELPVRQPASAQRGFSVNNLDSFDAFVFPGQQAFPHDVAHGGALPAEPPRVRVARERAASLRERIRRPGSAEDLASIVEAAQALGGDGFWTSDVVFFADAWRAPSADATGTSFSPGEAHGIAILYDYRAGTPACAGEVSATTTSDAVEYRAQPLFGATTLDAMLRTELEAEVERAIARAVRFAAGPPAEPPP